VTGRGTRQPPTPPALTSAQRGRIREKGAVSPPNRRPRTARGVPSVVRGAPSTVRGVPSVVRGAPSAVRVCPRANRKRRCLSWLEATIRGLAKSGGGLGGLDWDTVRPLIESILGDLDDVEVVVYVGR
jgi:hypothetical protein